ncbi:MAG: TatD family hydrolase [Treponema sp.]|jgi:TatD DNase family protein|nr:TatD family hydrolase [Treponema sp.]
MRLIDIGVNLMNSAFDGDREEQILKAKKAGVGPLIITGSSLEQSRAALDFARVHGLYATAGVHPHNARYWNKESAALIRSMALPGGPAAGTGTAAGGTETGAGGTGTAAAGTEAADAGAVAGAAGTATADAGAIALGECGLDYDRDYSPRAEQRRCFEEQVKLAAELKLPLFLHVRSSPRGGSAWEDFFGILKTYRRDLTRMVVHCFTGSAGELEGCLELDAYIGITGWVCDERRGRHLWPLLGRIPAKRLLLETDAPYLLPPSLSPGGRRGRNESANLVYIAGFIAQKLGKTVETLAEETFKNTVEFFNLKIARTGENPSGF